MITKGTVTAVGPPLQVRLDGATTASAATRLAAYTPVVGHRVRVAVDGSSLIVLGQEVA